MNFRPRTLLPFLLALPLVAQQPSPGASVSPTVQLDVTVTGRSGKPVAGLTRSNFSVLDNGVPQQILSFHAVQGPVSDPPVQIIVLVDTVNTSFMKVAYERDQISQFLRKSGPTLAYPLSFVFFSNTTTQMQRVPSRSTAALLDELDKNVAGLRTLGRNTGIYGAAERAQLSLKALSQIAALEQNTPGRKILIWISPGWAYLSGLRIYLSPSNQRQLFSAVVGISDALQSARITLDSIDPLGVEGAGFYANYYQAFLKGAGSPKEVQNGNLALQVLAQQSGGRVINSGNDIAEKIAACIEDASAFYTLTIPRAPADSADTFHSIQVKLPDTSLKARTINGYYAQPVGAAPGNPH